MNVKVCPNCFSKDVANIIYGYPSHELLEEANEGKVKLGGCIISVDDPEYACNACDHSWTKEDVIQLNYQNIERLIATVGGHFGENYEIDINLKSGQVQWRGELENVEERWDKKKRDHFRYQLRMTNILSWKKQYEKEAIRDGTSWSLVITVNNRKRRKWGTHAFPDEWEMFCSIVSEFIGKPFH
ncbi:hypothetical protein [Evansella cellulosilytica]|uniref:Uncharacterized protein n=1 Tax=Evansella cellulosilytica (strain ATCC 21833 / DSM 2522 / FERM P-1141 / JCM 9156 / N-4) TaxID=649639 RepID=E6U0T3_EVAC2|nr:hypothetical protein [Evansella cellulosilytica]ADU29131.1 hypothetical protein Bcell_0853 [Evansella cellulosilytica DSM 2522]